ncbi:hypothetical protein GGR53DRAFT_462162 [Hypoxylon sp. FL1150]|nr:hypothetical protein GGR53DRAFT_462162 [Hypoxylon sp. FL1150]
MFPSKSLVRQQSLRRGCGPSYPAVSPAYHKHWIQMAVIILIISCWIPPTAAISLQDSPRSSPTTETTTLLIDTRIPVLVDGHWQIMSEEEHRQLARRQPASQTFTVDVSAATATATATDTDTATATSTVATGPLPTPFDGALAANFSGPDGGGTCLNFINSFLDNSTFQACYPLSMLLKASTRCSWPLNLQLTMSQGSNSFFQAMRSLVQITQVIETSCKANKTSCATYLNDLAEQLTSDDNCGEDYQKENQVVIEAYKGMRSYEELYGAGCLQNPDTSAYCFVTAVTNLTTASNVYLYNLPLNSSLPASALPACDYCTSETMKIYNSASADRTKYIANTYVSAAEQINSECGANFVSAALPQAIENAGIATSQASSLLVLSILFLTVLNWIR